MSLLFIEPLVTVDVSTSTFLEGTRTSYVDYELYIPLDLNACFNDVTNSLKFQLPITDLDSEADFDKAQAWTPVSDGVLRLDGISTSGFDAQLEYADFKVQGSSNYTSLNPYMYSVNGLRPVITGDSVEDWYRNRCIVKSGIGTDRKLQSSDDFSVADATPRSTFEDILNHLFLGTTTTPSGVQVKPPVSPETRDAIQKWLVHEGIGVNSQRLANAIFDTRQSQDLMRKVLLLGKYQRNPGGFGTVELADKDIVSIPVDLRESSGNVISIRLNFVQTEHEAIPKYTGSSPTDSGELNNDGNAEETGSPPTDNGELNNDGEPEEVAEDDPLSLSGIRTMLPQGQELYKLSGAPVDTGTFIIQGSYAQVQRIKTGGNVTELTEFWVWHFADSDTWELGIQFQVHPDGSIEIDAPEEGKTDGKFTEAVREAVVEFANYQCIPEFSVASITQFMSPDYSVYKTQYVPPLDNAATYIVLVANAMMLEAQALQSAYVSTSPVYVFEQTEEAWALIRSYKCIEGVLTVDTGSVSWGDDVYTGLTGGSVSNLAEFDTQMMALNSLHPHPPPPTAASEVDIDQLIQLIVSNTDAAVPVAQAAVTAAQTAATAAQNAATAMEASVANAASAAAAAAAAEASQHVTTVQACLTNVQVAAGQIAGDATAVANAMIQVNIYLAEVNASVEQATTAANAAQSSAEQAALDAAATQQAADEQAAAEQAAAEQAAAAQAAIDAVNAAVLVAANTTIKGTIDLHNHAYAMYSNSATVTPTTLIIAAAKNMVTQANTGTGSISDPNGVVVYQYISESWQIRQMFEVVNNSLVSLRSESQGGSGLMWGGVNHTMDPKYNYNGVEVISAGAVLSNLVLKYSRY